MNRSLDRKLSVSQIALSCLLWLPLLSLNIQAEALMTKAEYADYSVRYQCAEILYHDDLNKKEEELIKIEDQYGLTDDNFDAFDELVTLYERDDQLLDDIRERVGKVCASKS